MNLDVYLYDANGSDEKTTLEKVNLQSLSDTQLLWINVLCREPETLEEIARKTGLENFPLKSILDVSERPKIDKFNDFYRFFIISVEVKEEDVLSRVPIDFIVGKNFIVTVSDSEVNYFREFREREKGETNIGALNADSFVATLLDLHIVSYFRALEKIENRVDKMDEKILGKDLQDEEFLGEMVKLRSEVSKLRRWFLPHRDVFYALARPDFKQTEDNGSAENFQLLNQHFETAVDSIESSRETVLTVFDLYATKTAHRMNDTIKRLTFITLILGILGVIAGTLGMNFKADFLDAPNGFWEAVAGMFIIAAGLILWAWRKRWI